MTNWRKCDIICLSDDGNLEHKIFKRTNSYMEFNKLPDNSYNLLIELVDSDNPSQLLSERFENASSSEKHILRGILKELTQYGYISVNWADNKPYFVTINNSARTYEERRQEYEKSMRKQSVTINSNNISIGNNNKIKNLNASVNGFNSNNSDNKRKTFYEKHPAICAFLISLAAGLVLLFSFWSKIIDFIEGLI